ncbi:complement factor H like 3 [Nematolebias whitei]|uniref:complement factor H like 3 n=1 Tax=Nematolebias whitei TaxID=451745 RepID=UPI001898116A|nr:complement factor H like 3 [Nematolebias whitei]
MSKITKLWALLLWMQTLTFVKCKDCTLEQFLKGPNYNSHFDTTSLEETYAGGRRVRVPCNVGYTGFFRLVCTEGNWEPFGSTCEPIDCGHPGDAEFADFELEKGEDFVFGSQVIYKCQKGYHMVSRNYRRRCTANGWDGVVPVCEASQCPVFHVGPHVQVIGNPGEAIFGNVVRFICASNDKILKGSAEIYCNENGAWVGEIPTCEEVKCDTPVIEHGDVVGSRQQYKENEELNFKCGHFYKRSDGRPSRCVKVGSKAEWVPTPGCELIKCGLTRLRGTTYNFQNKNLFLPQEKLQVTCGEKFYILNAKTTTAEVTCKENGQWDISPVCLEVRCPARLPNENLSGDDRTLGKNFLGDTVLYTCESYYEKTDGVSHATCTRDGWTPKPLCYAKYCPYPDFENAEITRSSRYYRNGEKVTYRCLPGDGKHFTATCERGIWTGNKNCLDVIPCSKPPISHGFAVGSFIDTVYYSCDEGYKLFTKSWWGQAKCTNGHWSKFHLCIENRFCGEAPEIPNGRVELRNHPGHSERFEIVCSEGYRTETDQLPCHDGTWDLEALQTICSPAAERCSSPPKVENAVVKTPYQSKYLSDTSVTYQCRKSYRMTGKDTITCKDGNWETENITCIPYCEKLHDFKLTVNSSMDKEMYEDGEVIEYVCNAPGTIEGSATCVNSKWTKTVECPAPPCEIGELTSNLRISGFPPKDNRVNARNKIRFFCLENYDLEGSAEIECLETGMWKSPFPNCSKKCEVPEVAKSLLITPSAAYYSKGANIRFECRESGRFIEGKKQIECLGNRTWSAPPPTCEIKCKVPTLTENVEIQSPAQDQAVSIGRTITFTCRHDWLSMQGNSAIECLGNGQWNGQPPTCTGSSGCRSPPHLENGDTVEISKQEYEEGEQVEYVCQFKYKIEGGPYKTCTRGVWTGDIRCLKPCTVDTEKMNKINIKFARGDEDKLYAPHDDHLTFVCKRGRQVGSGSMRRRCNDGEMELPRCG